MNDQVEAEMPRYVSHKTVHALEIDHVYDAAADGSRKLSFRDRGYAPAVIAGEVFARYVPVPGDFYIVYADGYKSFSPRKAFLEGYRRDDLVTKQPLGQDNYANQLRHD